MLNNAKYLNFFSKYLHYSNKMPTFVARKWRNCIPHRKKFINLKSKVYIDNETKRFYRAVLAQ